MNRYTTEKVDKITTKAEKSVKKIARKMKIIAFILGLISFGIMFFLAFYNVSKWYDSNQVIFQAPIIIKLQAPIVIEKRKNDVKMPVKEVKKEVKLSAYPDGYEEAYDKVWLMESGRGSNKGGLNGYCIENGGVNEIGYAPHDKYCFKDQEEQKDTFMTWLTNRINKVKMPYCDDINQCLLIYSNGSYGL